MSGVTPPWLRARLAVVRRPRFIALLGAAGLLAAPLSVLYGIVEVTRDPTLVVALAGVALLAGTVLARLVRVAVAVGIALTVLAAGLGVYLTSLSRSVTVGPLIGSNLSLLTGRSLLQIDQAALWALGVTVPPVLVTWYLAVRRRYAAAALPAGGLLGYLVLTGDAGTTVTLLGVVSGTVLVGFGDLDGRDASPGVAQSLTILLALMVLVPAGVSVVPAGASSPLGTSGDGDGTVEASLLGDDAQLEIVGSISLSPARRFTVESERPDYWRANSFDRYTGEGWVRTGEPDSSTAALSPPPGDTVTIVQSFTATSTTDVMPAAWRPTGVNATVSTQVTRAGGLRPGPGATLAAGETYTVTSEVPRASPDELADAGTDYPREVRERYTQLPASTPDRVQRRTARLTARADNPYQTARVVERWLERNRDYSLSVEAPDGNVADAFLFEMERGYCTYYATTMVTMLRTQGIPARLVTGYTTGEETGVEEYTVRGLDSHAWVEVYFPETGWIRFDPTPAAPRRAAEQERLGNDTGTDVAPTSAPDRTPTPTEPARTQPTPTTPGNPPGPDGAATGVPAATPTGGATEADRDGGGLELPDPPSREEAALGLVVVAGAVAGLRRTGVDRRLARWWELRVGDPDPERVLALTYERLEQSLARRHRPREDGETVRAYLDAVDAADRPRRIAELYERARYAGTATEADAERARRLLREQRRDRL